MRARINKNLVFTTSESKTKQNYVMKNKTKPTVYTMSILGVKKRITYTEYLRLQKAGYNVEASE